MNEKNFPEGGLLSCNVAQGLSKLADENEKSWLAQKRCENEKHHFLTTRILFSEAKKTHIWFSVHKKKMVTPKQMSANLGEITCDDFMPRHIHHAYDKDMGNGVNTEIL